MRSPLRRFLPAFIAGLLMVLLFVAPVGAQRRGSFGGGGRSFGGGGFGRSFGGGGGGGFGGGFGRSRSSSGSFGNNSGGFGSSQGTQRSFSRSSSSSSSFGRGGAFGSSGRINSTSMNAPSAYRGVPYTTSSRFYYNGGYHPYYGYGGYGDYWFHPSWYYWIPFHPAFYYGSPYYYQGAYYPGGFSFTRFLMGIVFIGFVIWLLSKIFGGGKRTRYTSYR